MLWTVARSVRCKKEASFVLQAETIQGSPFRGSGVEWRSRMTAAFISTGGTTMKKAIYLVGAAALIAAGGAFAQTTAPAGKGDVREDNREIRRDNRDIRKDRREVGEDKREV